MQIDIGYRPAHSMAKVSLNHGESIMAESGAMVGMSTNVQMQTGMSQNSGGGLLGGLLGVEIAKALTRQTRSTGDAMVWPIASGLVVGRIGCFLAGLHDDTYGVATTLPWGVDFGDGVRRHPTQLYDIAVVLALAAAVNRRFGRVPGLAFKLFLAGYLAWRALIDGFKPVPHAYAGGLSGIQWVCLAALGVYLPVVARAWASWHVLGSAEGPTRRPTG